MSKETKTAVKIPCNSTVKNFTIATLQRLGLDAAPSKVYNKIVSGDAVIPKSSHETNRLIDMLLKKIPLCLPPVPPTTAEKAQYKDFIEKWCAALKEKQVQQFQPVYLRDEVNKVLQRRNYPQCCQRIHLVWCLSLKGEAHMTPEKIADAIIEYDGTDWDNVLPLKNDTAYFVRLSNNTDEEKQKFLDAVEFIYSLSSQSADPTFVEKLQNDLDVLSEFEKWKDDITTYKYADRYQELIDRLQTAPVARKRKKNAKKVKLSATKVTPDCSTEKEVSAPANVGPTATPSVQDLMQHQQPENTGTPSEGDEPEKDDNASIITHDDANKEESLSTIEKQECTTEQPENDDDSEHTDDMNAPEQWEMNMWKLLAYLDEKTENDAEGKKRIKYAEKDIDAFCHLPNFDILFESLKGMIESGTVKFPGGFAVGKIREMLRASGQLSNKQELNP